MRDRPDELQEEARLGLHEVRILVAAGDGFDIDLVAADFLGERGKVGGGGDHIEFLCLRCWRGN